MKERAKREEKGRERGENVGWKKGKVRELRKGTGKEGGI